MNLPVLSRERQGALASDPGGCSLQRPNASFEADMQSATSRLPRLLGSKGLNDGLIMALSMGSAGGLDYAVSLLAGRWLVPAEYGVFIAVAAVMQVLAQLTNTIRNVVAFYTAELSSRHDTSQGVASFVRRAWRWGWRWRCGRLFCRRNRSCPTRLRYIRLGTRGIPRRLCR